MKNFALALVSLVSLGVYAQDEKPASSLTGDTYNFTSKDMTIDSDAKTITLNEDASFKDAIIEIRGATQIVFDQANKEIIATGPYDFTIDGEIQLNKSEVTVKKLRYKIGEAVAYIE